MTDQPLNDSPEILDVPYEDAPSDFDNPAVEPARPAWSPSQATSEERTWASLAHLSILLNLFTGFLGIVAALIIYLVYQDRSRYVAYQSLQSLLLQLIFWVGAGLVAGLVWTITIPLLLVLVGLCLLPLALFISALPIVALVYGVIGGIKTSQGDDFKYLWIGDWVRGTFTGR
jgi:uncharacterized Tic20 family protein